MKRGRTVFFVVNSPDVMKSTTSDNTYVFFGEAKQEDLSALQQQAAAMVQQQALKNAAAAGEEEVPPLVETQGTSAAQEAVDESGVKPKHIELVLEQVPSATRAQVRLRFPMRFLTTRRPSLR